MKIEQKLRRLFGKIGSYKYAALILLLGITLMLIPQRESKQPEPITEREAEVRPEPLELETRLKNILCCMDGVGSAEVLLTLETGMSYQYQVDMDRVVKQEEEETQQQTVLVSNGSGGESPVTVRTVYPTYQGALILCQGADSAAVRLDIIKAVSDLTGLSSDKISVIKMKGN